MADKVARSNPSGPKTPFDAASLDQVKAGKVVIELADGSDAVLGTVEQIIAGLVKDEVANLLRQKTLDLEYQGNEVWETSTGTNNLSVLRGGVDADAINAITDWASSYTIPSGTDINGALVVRLDKGENPNNYRLFNGIALNNVGDFNVPIFITSPTYDYYISPVSLIGRYATGETIVLQHHGDDGHTFYHGGVPAIETEIQDVRDDVAGKEDTRPFDAFIDRNYYVRTNRDALTYHLQLHNIVSALLPDVDTLVILMRGGVVHNASFDPTASTDQVVPIELSTSEATNIATNVRDDTTIAIELSFRNGSTQVLRETIQIPVVAAPPRREERVLLAWDLTRNHDASTFTMPTDYGQWQFLKMIGRDDTSEETIIVFTSDLARGNLTQYGRGKINFNWNASTRVLEANNDETKIVTAALI